MKRLHELIATVFGLGYIPFASGTFGSLAGLALCLVLHGYLLAYVLAFIALFIIGIISAGRVEAESGIKDPSVVVIDEFACIFVAFLFVPLTPFYVITGFLLYRVLDIFKISPIRSVEKLAGGWGIMLDDLVAALYTNLILQIIIAFS